MQSVTFVTNDTIMYRIVLLTVYPKFALTDKIADIINMIIVIGIIKVEILISKSA